MALAVRAIIPQAGRWEPDLPSDVPTKKMMNIPPNPSLLTSWLKPFILLGVVLLLAFHPYAQTAAGLCLFVSLGGWFLEGSLMAGNGATWASMGRALTGPGTLPFYVLLLVGASTLGFTRVDTRPTVALVAQASGSNSGETGHRPVAAKAKAPEGGLVPPVAVAALAAAALVVAVPPPAVPVAAAAARRRRPSLRRLRLQHPSPTCPGSAPRPCQA